VGEEIGWRGFALPRLRAWRGTLVGTLVLGVFWGLWHIPAWIGQGLSLGFGPMAVRVLGIVATAFVFTWIYYGSGGSLVPAVIYHASIVLERRKQSNWRLQPTPRRRHSSCRRLRRPENENADTENADENADTLVLERLGRAARAALSKLVASQDGNGRRGGASRG
jgi:hypothetical protein